MSEWATATPGTALQGCPKEKQKKVWCVKNHNKCVHYNINGQTNKTTTSKKQNLSAESPQIINQYQKNPLEVEI